MPLTFLILLLRLQLPFAKDQVNAKNIKFGILILIFLLMPVPLSRVILQDHSVEQVIVGTTEGVLFGIMSFAFAKRYLGPQDNWHTKINVYVPRSFRKTLKS
jgi:hypothetical protein